MSARKNNFLITALICSCHLFSQPLSFSENEQAHRRYWYYRTRFINDFVKLGSAQGDGICFPQRNYNNGQLSSQAKVGPDQIDITNQYLSALALEYKLLSRNHQSTTETVKEIYYLLRALNRLDARADCFWTGNAPPTDDMSAYDETLDLNGFMLREDMPRNYIDSSAHSGNYKHFNYGLTEYNSTATAANLSYTGLAAITRLSNDNKFSNYVGFPNPGSHPQSIKDLSCVHDKYQSLFIAFMLLVKYIPDGTGYYENGVLQSFQDGETDIVQEVRNITNRCHPYIRGNRFGGTHSDWVLEYPDRQYLAVGKDATPYSYALAKMICYINGGYPWSSPCNSYQDLTSSSNGFLTYNLLPFNPIPSITPALGSEDAAVFIGNCMAGSNAPVMSPGWSPVPIQIPAGIAMRMNSLMNHLEWTELLRRVLHQNQPLIAPKNTYADMINQAPCPGPYNHSGGNDGGIHWRSQDRLEHPKSLIDNSAPPGNYPGVDYMLLHNLYYEYLNQESDAGNVESGAYKTAYNLMDNYDNGVWPKQVNHQAWGYGQSQNQLIGVDANVSQLTNPPGPGTLLITKIPAYIKVFQNLSSTAKIYADASPSAPGNTIPAKIEYRAGKSITLENGFEVKAGAGFFAYIKRYLCTESDYGAGMRQAQNPDERSTDYLSDVMNEMVAIHYVNSPPSASDRSPYGREEGDERRVSFQGSFDQNTVVISPNPSMGIFHVHTQKTGAKEILSLNVYDMNGGLIYSATDVGEECDLPLEHCRDGIYIVQVTSNQGRSNVIKINIIHP